MAVSNGSFGTGYYKDRNITFSWSLVRQDIAGNYSVINYNWKGTNGGNTWYYVKNAYLNVNGSRVYTQPTDNKIQLANGTVLASGQITIYHNDDGSKTFSADGGGTIFNYGTWQTGSGSWELPRIARASQPSCVTYPNTTQNVGNVGGEITIHMNRKSTSFTHTVKYAWGNKSGTIATGVGDNVKWTIPKNFAENVTSGLSGTGTITVDTYNGGTKIGTKSVGFTATIPDTAEFKPKISKVELSEAGSMPSSLGFFVQNISKIKGVITASGAYGSTIKKYSVSLNNQTFNSSTFTTSTISLVNPKLKITVTDTRDRTATYEQTITVLEYRVPTMTSFSSFRNASDQTKIKISFSCSIYSLNNKNTHKFVFYYKKSGSSTYSSVNVDSSKIVTTTSGNTVIYSGNFDIISSDTNSSYDVYLQAIDLFKTINSKYEFINTIFRLLNITEDKRYFAIGKLHEKRGYIENAIPEIFYENMYRQEGDYNGIVLSCPSITDGKINFNSSNNTLELTINGVVYSIPLTKK